MNLPLWTSSFSSAENLSQTKLYSELVNSLQLAIINRSSIFLVGDGIYAGISATLAGDLSARLSISGYSPRIFTPSTNNVFISTISTSIEFDYAYSLYIRSNLSKHNLVIFLSDTGNSINLVRTSQMLDKIQGPCDIDTWNISGSSGGALSKACKNTLLLTDVCTNSLPSHQFYFLSKLFFQTTSLLLDPKSPSPDYPPIESNRNFTRVNLNKIA